MTHTLPCHQSFAEWKRPNTAIYTPDARADSFGNTNERD